MQKRMDYIFIDLQRVIQEMLVTKQDQVTNTTNYYILQSVTIKNG
jgi:hypothetical protein